MTVKWNGQFTELYYLMTLYIWNILYLVNIPSADPEKNSKSLIGQKDNCACIFGNLGM